MLWLFVLICLTFCFTAGLSSKYKDEIIERKEQSMKDKENFNLELLILLEENATLRSENEAFKGL